MGFSLFPLIFDMDVPSHHIKFDSPYQLWYNTSVVYNLPIYG